MTQDVNVVLLDFHHKRGKEMVVENEDGSYTILINSRLAYSGQLAAYKHAMKHIENNDFQGENVQSIESAAHELTISEDAERIPSAKYLQRIKAIQARRRKIQRQLKELQNDMDYLRDMGAVDDFARAEQQWLYGNDL